MKTYVSICFGSRATAARHWVSFAFFLLIALPQFAFAQPATGSQAATPDWAQFKRSLQQHPRLLLFAGEEAAIQQNISGNALWQQVQQVIVGASDSLLTVAPIQRTLIGHRLLDQSREALRRMFFLSYAYRTTQNVRYAQRAEQEMLAIAAFSDWNPQHFLDVAEMTMAVAIGYDWLYGYLPAASKTVIRDAIIKKGLEPSFDTKYNWFVSAKHNWNQVCNAGMTYGALAVYEDAPELAQTVVDRAIHSLPLSMHEYAPDGVYPEGYAYWNYGTSFNVLLLAALDKLFGQDFGLSRAPGFLQTARYFQHMIGATGKPFNYSDSREQANLSPAMFWFAARQNDPSLLWVERNYLLHRSLDLLAKDRMVPAMLLWGKGIDMNKIPPPKAPMWAGGGPNPVAMMRSSWKDPNAIYVGMKGGSAALNHAHMDVGSFVMDALGVRWAMDFGMQDYASLESKGLYLWGNEQDAQRWTVFRYTNLVHNTLTVNGKLQNVSGSAPIVRYGSKEAFMHAAVDLSSVYSGALVNAVRGIAIVGKRYVVVRDELETGNEAVTVRWTMLTPARVSISDSSAAELEQGGKRLKLQVQSPLKVTMKTWSTDPPKDYDAPNPGTTLVGFEVTIPPNTKVPLNVMLVPETSGAPKIKKVKPLNEWK